MKTDRLLQIITLAVVVAGWIFTYGVRSSQAQADHEALTHDQEILQEVQVLDSEMQAMLKQHENTISDHEVRLRLLENGSRRHTAWDLRIDPPKKPDGGNRD